MVQEFIFLFGRRVGLLSGFASLRFFTITTRRDGKGTKPFASLAQESTSAKTQPNSELSPREVLQWKSSAVSFAVTPGREKRKA